MAFRRFGTFRTPHGWLGIDGDGNIFQRGLKRDGNGTAVVPEKPLQAYQSEGLIKITSGTIGNKIPTINGTPINDPAAVLNVPANGIWHVMVTCPADISNDWMMFPSDVPTITIVSTMSTDADDNAYLSLASITVNGTNVTISNHLSGSLWGERMKIQDELCLYYFNSI